MSLYILTVLMDKGSRGLPEVECILQTRFGPERADPSSPSTRTSTTLFILHCS